MTTWSRVARASIVLALSLSYFSYVFQVSHHTFLKSGLGDWIDPYFINYLLEHWHHSVWSFTDPSSPPIFFPARGTLGYSHGLILYAPFYLAVRPFFHPFQAYTLTLFLVLETGSVCLYVVLRKFLALGFIESLLLSTFFFTSANVVNSGVGIWSQRASVFLIPPILLLALVSARMPGRRLRVALAFLSGLLFALLFTQDFYTGQFAILVLTFLLGGVLLCERRRVWRAAVGLWHIAATAMRDPGRLSRPPSRWWLGVACLTLAGAGAVLVHPIPRTTIGSWSFTAKDPSRPLFIALLAAGWFVWRRWRVGGRVGQVLRRVGQMSVSAALKRDTSYIRAVVLGGFLGGLVFVWIYLGAYREHHVFPEDQLIHSLTVLAPSRWHGPSDLLKALRTYDDMRSFLLVFLVGILAWVPCFRVDKKSKVYGLWFLCVSFIVLLIPLRLYDFSIWKTFFRPLPGLAVVRDPKRIIEVYELAVVLLTALFLTKLRRKPVFRVSIALLVLVLIVTQWNREVLPFERPNSVYSRWVEAPIDIDASCASFFVRGASEEYMARSGHMWTLYGVDSMFISLNHSIPTLNGYSAWVPDGWGLANPQEAGYAEAVARWIDQHHLLGVCELDIEKRTMAPYRPALARD